MIPHIKTSSSAGQSRSDAAGEIARSLCPTSQHSLPSASTRPLVLVQLCDIDAVIFHHPPFATSTRPLQTTGPISRFRRRLHRMSDLTNLGTGTTPEDAARLIESVLAEVGWDADASTVAARVRRLNVGLPCEDEFSVVCGWLGKCPLLHKLDKHQLPISSRKEFQVPDLLAFFATQSARSPVLIEVKSRNAQTLSLKPDALAKLNNYADLLKLPLLIAWKCQSIWTLFEAKHLRKAVKNFDISLDLAQKENLLGVLAGDVAYTIGAGAGVRFQFRKDELVTQKEDGDRRAEEWRETIDDVFFTDYDGNRRTDLDSEVQSLFTAWDLEEQQEHTDTHITMSFIAGSQGMQFSHTALVHLLNWGIPSKQEINWRHLLYKEKVIANIGNFSSGLTQLYARRSSNTLFTYYRIPCLTLFLLRYPKGEL